MDIGGHLLKARKKELNVVYYNNLFDKSCYSLKKKEMKPLKFFQISKLGNLTKSIYVSGDIILMQIL